MTSPVEFPMYGKFKKMELSKEHLLAFWDMVLNRSDFNVRTGEKVEDITKEDDWFPFTVANRQQPLSCRGTVILALGRTGTPRKLGVKGEELPKVMYRLIEADHYVNKQILVVGGGDSAIEAALGLANQQGNQVTLSYRQDRFSRIKDRNAKRVEEAIRSGKIKMLFSSDPHRVHAETAVLEIKGTLQKRFRTITSGSSPEGSRLTTFSRRSASVLACAI